VSKRPIQAKQLRRLRKAMRQKPATQINLIDYIVDRRLVRSRKEAHQMLMDGKVKAEQFVIGREKGTKLTPKGEIIETWHVAPIVPSTLRGKISVMA
jgi:hypothetical protein